MKIGVNLLKLSALTENIHCFMKANIIEIGLLYYWLAHYDLSSCQESIWVWFCLFMELVVLKVKLCIFLLVFFINGMCCKLVWNFYLCEVLLFFFLHQSYSFLLTHSILIIKNVMLYIQFNVGWIKSIDRVKLVGRNSKDDVTNYI